MTEQERFWSKVDVRSLDECWEWAASLKPVGYGQFHRVVDGKRKTAYAHRVAYEYAHGEVPPGLDVCHACDNPPCVNPLHLFAGSTKDNMDDMYRKGRWRHWVDTGTRHSGMKLTQEDVAGIRNGYSNGTTLVELARRYNISYNHAWQVKEGHCWNQPRVLDGRLVVRGRQLVEPIRRRAKRTGES